MLPKHQETLRKVRNTSSFSFSSIVKNGWAILGFLMIIFIFLLPVIRLIWLSITSEGELSLQLYLEVLTAPATWPVIKNTVWVVVFSSLLAIGMGVGMAWVMAYVNIRGKKWMNLFIFLPFIVPSYITTLAWVQFFGNNGPIDYLLESFPLGSISAPNLYSIQGIIFVLGISHYPLVYLFTVDVFRKIPRDLEQAANVSGASKRTVFLKIIFPMTLPGIAGGGLLAFLSNLDNFGIPAFLGIPANIRVLSTYIYEQIIGYGPSAFARASVLSVFLGIIALIGTLIQWFVVRKSNVNETAKRDMEPRYYLSPIWRSVAEIGIWSFLLVSSLVPFIVMAATSFIKAYGVSFKWENLSLKNYRYLLFEDQKVMQAVGNSLSLALITLVICAVVGTFLAYLRFKRNSITMRIVEMILTIPYALPGTVLALCMILMWVQPILGWKPGVYGTIWILLIAYITRFLVLQLRGSLTAFTQIDPTMEEAAQTAGASHLAKWSRILLPLLLPGVIGGALLVGLTALTELTVSSLLWSSGAETIGVVIFSFEQAGYSTYSTAFSSLIVLAILIGGVIFMWMENVWKKRVLRHHDSN
ncbi:iron ABC transporter permease [Peribacillus cavernae]|uniref:Iron ABC transporter permease n=1 Tax=Peribacillus cavernae TaxID=1674310 RepID=A0A3S0U0D8_9BACI|nr:iron ABC transporter permease [Peribacillus cavernae]MDQ0219201.1 iron(III) transport system permease protein [Peribacillus cavernae]RUQ28579.1 iron ABC transporter permease [Peribacillus cavernae]